MHEKKTADFLALAALIFFAVMILLAPGQHLKRSYDIALLEGSWTCEAAGETRRISLPGELQVPADTQIRLSIRLPEQDSTGWGIRFRSRLQRAEVRLDGERIYQYPDRERTAGILPSIWNFVEFPEEWGGKTLEILLESPYSAFSGILPEVYIGNYNDLVEDTVVRQVPYLILSLLLGILGAAVILLSVIFRKYQRSGYQRTLGILLVFVSLWLCGESRMPMPFPGPEAVHLITMVSMLLLPVFVLAYLGARWPSGKSRMQAACLYACLACQGFLLLLQILGIRALVETLPVTHTLLGLTMVYAGFLYLRAARNRQAPWSELICILLILASAAVELVRFYALHVQVGMYVRLSFLIYALDYLRRCIADIYQVRKENARLEKQLQISRLELMNSQIRPHFIYNTLNSIRALIRIDPELAYRAVYDFSTYLRANRASLKGKEQVSFGEELKHIRAYLNIEKLRLGPRLKTEFQVEAEDFQVPHLSIQPLVENAVKHGIWKKEGEGTVRILERETEEFHEILVEDDGIGFDPADLEKQEDGRLHMGIRNIRFRIREIAGGTVEIRSHAGGGTRVQVCIPRMQEREVDRKDARDRSGR